MTAPVGPNGAGKTSLLGLISGIVTPSSGSITSDETCFYKLTWVRRARKSVAHIEQGRVTFPFLTVQITWSGPGAELRAAPELPHQAYLGV